MQTVAPLGTYYYYYYCYYYYYYYYYHYHYHYHYKSICLEWLLSHEAAAGPRYKNIKTA